MKGQGQRKLAWKLVFYNGIIGFTCVWLEGNEEKKIEITRLSGGFVGTTRGNSGIGCVKILQPQTPDPHKP